MSSESKCCHAVSSYCYFYRTEITEKTHLQSFQGVLILLHHVAVGRMQFAQFLLVLFDRFAVVVLQRVERLLFISQRSKTDR